MSDIIAEATTGQINDTCTVLVDYFGPGKHGYVCQMCDEVMERSDVELAHGSWRCIQSCQVSDTGEALSI